MLISKTRVFLVVCFMVFTAAANADKSRVKEIIGDTSLKEFLANIQMEYRKCAVQEAEDYWSSQQNQEAIASELPLQAFVRILKYTEKKCMHHIDIHMELLSILSGEDGVWLNQYVGTTIYRSEPYIKDFVQQKMAGNQ